MALVAILNSGHCAFFSTISVFSFSSEFVKCSLNLVKIGRTLKKLYTFESQDDGGNMLTALNTVNDEYGNHCMMVGPLFRSFNEMWMEVGSFANKY